MSDQEIHLCTYCNQPATYQFKNGKWCCEPVNQRCPAIKEKNRKAVQKLYNEGKLNQQEIQKNRTKESIERQGWSKGLSKHTDERLKKRGKQLHQKYENGELTPSRLGDHHSDEDKDKILAKVVKGNQKPDISRFKGLGEMSALQLK